MAQDKQLPYSALSESMTKQLECSFSMAIGRKDMRTNLNDLDIKNAEDVAFYTTNNKEKTPLDSFAKALVVDYIYQRKEAIEFYRKSLPLTKNNIDVAYDIAYFLARDGNVEAAVSVIDEQYTIMNELALSKAQAFIYLANGLKIPHNVLFKCKKRGLTLEDIQETFNNCSRATIF
jgi:hypothetical protein